MSHAQCSLPPLSIIRLLLVHGLWGQESSASQAKLVLASGTPVKLQLAQTISSAHAHKNDPLKFVVVEDVTVKGLTLIRAGAEAKGSVLEVKGKRPLGMGGDVIIQVGSVGLTTGEQLQLCAREEFKGRSHTIRMGVEMIIAGAIYMPVAPVFLMSPGRDSTVLKGTELTAYTKNDAVMDARELPETEKGVSELGELIKLLPPRVLNGEGREGDMLNLIFLASEDDLQEIFAHAGWLKADHSKLQIIWRLLWQRNHYTKLPMDKLYVFGRAQDYSYVLPDPKSIVARRHHLRIWNTDRVMDGVPLWVGAATHDVSIEFVKHKFRFFHRIDPNVDAERDFIARDLAETRRFNHENYVRCVDPVFSAQTATGQTFHSDSRLLFLELNGAAVAMPGATEIAAASR